jgi:multiple sugar transport system substrate-binding protein
MKKVSTWYSLILLVGLLVSPQLSPGAEPIKLNFLEVMTSPARTAVVREMIEKFQAAHPNISVNLISPPYEQADNKLTMMMNAREPLDIVEVRELTQKQYINNGLLENLETRLKSWPEAKTLLPVTLEAARYVDNTAYMIPESIYVKALFMRTDILKKLGVESAPTTIQQLYDLAKKVTKPAENQYGFTFRGKGQAYKASDYLILSDMPNIDVKRGYVTKEGKSVFEDPQFLKSLKAYIDLFKTAVPADGINWGFNEQVNAFVSGVTVFMVQDPDTVPLLDRQLGRDKYTVVPMPLGASGKTYCGYGYAGLAIPSYSKNKEAAWEFIKYFSSPTVNAEFNKKYGPLPIHSAALKDDPHFNTGAYKAWAVELNTPDRYVFVNYPWNAPQFPAWGQAQQQAMQAALLGQITPEEAAAKFANHWK